MTDDLARRIHRQQDALRDGDIDQELFDSLIAKLRRQFGDGAVEAVLRAEVTRPSGGTTMIVTGNSKLGAAVAGSVHGNIYVNGRWARDEATLVRHYLEHVIARCETLPLQGIREQKSSTDVLAIKLDRVYTQLATTHSEPRERYDRGTAHLFNTAAYLRQHNGAHLLPLDQRLSVRIRRANEELIAGDLLLRSIHGDQLKRQVRNADEITFFGPQLVTEAIVENNRLVLLGEPGSGKSTALRYLTLTLAEAGLHKTVDLNECLHGWKRLGTHNRPLPIFYPLLTFAQRLAKDTSLAGTAHDLWNALANFIDPAPSSTGLATVVRDRLHSGDVLLLLDGLDEVATEESRRKVVQAVQQFATEYPQCRIVVTCRVRAYEGERNRAWQLAGWPTSTLADWTLAQMEHFVTAWYREAARASQRSEEWRKHRVDELRKAMTRRVDLQRLGKRPLLLTIMALVHFNDGRLPEDSVSLYRRCIEILLGQWELGRPDGTVYGTLMNYIGLPNHSVETLRPLLEAAAFRAHEASTAGSSGSLDCDKLRVMVMDALHERGHPNPFEGADKFLDYADKRAGLIQASDAGDAYMFPHLTFQEYLAGIHLTSGLHVVNKIMARRNEDRWRVPIILGVGDYVSGNKLEMPYRLFDELLTGDKRPPEQLQRDLLFATDLGKELGWDRLEQGDQAFKRVRQRLAALLSTIVAGTTLPASERVRTGAYLSELGDSRPGVCTLPPAMITISGGTFVIGHTQVELDALRAAMPKQSWFDDTLNEQPVTVAPFAIGRYPVTNAQYQYFIDDHGYNPDAPWWNQEGRAWLKRGSWRAPGYGTDTSVGITSPNHPVTGVTWYEAQAFCRWLTQHLHDGSTYRLPTEAEWEWAARGRERRMYPWGNAEPNEENANYGNIYTGTTPTGCFVYGATPEGVLDLAGNMWEWTSSVYAPYPYESGDGNEDTDDVAPKGFTLRGGSWYDESIYLRAAGRSHVQPTDKGDNIGFRLAMDL